MAEEMDDTVPDLTKRLRAVLQGEVEKPPTDSKDTDLLSLLDRVHPADIAEALARLSDTEALRVFQVLDAARAAEVLDELDTEKTRYLLDHDLPARIAEMLDILPMDDAAELISEAPPARQETFLADLSRRNPEDAAEVRELLSYPPASAGRLMTDKFVRLSLNMTVEEAFTAVRYADSTVETLNDLYVVEPHPNTPKEERLLGVLSLRDLVRAKSDQRIESLMVPQAEIISVRVDTDQEVVARLISKYDFLALPVLDIRENLVGIVTVDDIVDVLVSETTEDVLRQSAITTEPGVINQPYFSVPIWRVVRSRVTWLVLLFLAETATGTVLRHFDSELAKVTALSFFIPLLIGTGGNTGAQTVSTIIRGMALGEIRFRDTWRVLLRELCSGLFLGLLLGVIAFGRALMWNSGLHLSMVVGLTILAICAWANTIGSLIPLIAQRFKIDPALVSAPLITTLVDATGLAIYLMIAKLLLEQLR